MMQHPSMISLFAPFIGHPMLDCIDAIKAAALVRGYSVNVTDPVFNKGPIDKEPKRFNVHTDEAGVITNFTIG